MKNSDHEKPKILNRIIDFPTEEDLFPFNPILFNPLSLLFQKPYFTVQPELNFIKRALS